MRLVHPDKWVPCDGITLEEAANTAVRCDNEHVLVIAGLEREKRSCWHKKRLSYFKLIDVKNRKNTGDQVLRQMLHRI